MSAQIINLSERRAMREHARHTIGTTGATIYAMPYGQPAHKRLNELATTRREMPSEATLRALQAEYEAERKLAERLLLTTIGEL